MEFEILKVNGQNIAILKSDQFIINELQDALDLLANAGYQESNRIIIQENQITQTFFDLKSRLAGEILQKFSTYNFRLSIIGDFSKYPGKSLKDFIFESNKYGRINFVNSMEEAIERLAGN
jgi:hypothetical protein